MHFFAHITYNYVFICYNLLYTIFLTSPDVDLYMSNLHDPQLKSVRVQGSLPHAHAQGCARGKAIGICRRYGNRQISRSNSAKKMWIMSIIRTHPRKIAKLTEMDRPIA